MSSLFHEGQRGTFSTQASSSEGFQQGSDRVIWKIVNIRWSSPVGEGSFQITNKQTMSSFGPVVWEQWSTPRLLLGQTASLLILQGAPISKLFEGVRFENREEGSASGHFLLLKGDLSETWHAPMTLNDVVLARVLDYPSAMTFVELLGHLIPHVLT